MALTALSASAVEAAIREYDTLGRATFLSKYGIAAATKFVLIHDGRRYDSKAIAGAAYGFDHPDEGPLPASAFSGGDETIRALETAGYKVAPMEEGEGGSPQRLLERILGGYQDARRGIFGRTAPIWQDFQELKKAFESSSPVARRPTVTTAWSTGQGQWARVPWVAFLDSRETTTTQAGVYPVLLFREDMSGVYATIAQGVTEPMSRGRQSGLAELGRVASRIRAAGDELRSAGFTLDSNIDLRSSSPLARDYEVSTVAHKFYELGAVPTDASILADLEQALAAVDDYLTSGAPEPVPSALPAAPLDQVAEAFRVAVDASGLAVPLGHGDRLIALLAALVTKPFVILSGLSGSGKTQLALRLGEWFGEGAQQRRFLPVPVRPDWTGPEALFGYEDALRAPRDGRAAWFVPATLEFLLNASHDSAMPYLILLDEMNLAHVERYFSDFLSGVESREPVVPNLAREEDGEWRLVKEGPPRLALPRNVFVVGTINVDETTYLFSPKVLDRATTFEIRTGTDELRSTQRRPLGIPPADPQLLRALADAVADDEWQFATPSVHQEEVSNSLRSLHARLLKSGDEFGHRVFYESLRLAAAFHRLGAGELERALDHIVLLKILPRIHGSRRRTEPVLRMLRVFAYDPLSSAEPENRDIDPDATPLLPLSAEKIERMLRAVEINQFVSFTE